MRKKDVETVTTNNNESDFPVAAIAIVLGGLSFVGAGTYPYIRKLIDKRKLKGSRTKNDEKIEL